MPRPTPETLQLGVRGVRRSPAAGDFASCDLIQSVTGAFARGARVIFDEKFALPRRRMTDGRSFLFLLALFVPY